MVMYLEVVGDLLLAKAMARLEASTVQAWTILNTTVPL